MNPNHTFYIDRHPGSISLDGEWRFCWNDAATDAPEALGFDYTSNLPASGYRCLEQAGILPDPYFGTNSRLYNWPDKKIWYFRRSFTLPDIAGRDVYLCFEGICYTCRVWLNGEEIVSHEGMFGGPITEISAWAKPGENELVVEVTPPAPDAALSREHDARAHAEIVPWNIRRDASTSNGDFIVFGIWRTVRIEILPKYHLSRPHLYTVSLDGNTAQLHLEAEIADPQVKELDVVSGDAGSWSSYSFAYSDNADIRPTGKKLDVAVTLTEKSTGDLAYASRETVDIQDKFYVVRNEKYRECQFFEKELVIENPRLWWPNGLGAAHLYTVTLELFDEDGTTLDVLSFDTGIRTLTYERSAGPRLRQRWDNWQYVINGRKFFVRGMNWMPIDFLFDCRPEDYRWTLELAKNMGIQLIRVWSGGGMPEDDLFYSLCDEYGMLVMQDSFIANCLSDKWNREVLQAQVCRNLYRIRNHPSLASHTGGNEINPYAQGNDAAMWVIAREIEDLDPSRKFYNTSPDKGSAHIYRDMEPVWYRKNYGALPFIGESGIHSFPNAKSLRQLMSPEEYNRRLSDIYTEAFKTENPELCNHFTEFIPARIPRMMSRASIINNTRGIDLSDLCEATQMASHEFYQIMANALQENYPASTGLLPWVFKRPWTTVAVQMVDGMGDPIAPYYALKNAYAPLVAEVALRELCFAPGETFTPDLRLLVGDVTAHTGLTVTLELYDPELKLVRTECFTCDVTAGETSLRFDCQPFTIPAEWAENFFFLRASVKNAAGILLQQSFYHPKVLSRFADEASREEFRAKPQNNIDFVEGPWLKPQIAAHRGAMTLTLLEKSVRTDGAERRLHMKAEIANAGDVPLFPVKLDALEDRTLTMASDNYFVLAPGTSRVIETEIRLCAGAADTVTLALTAWNADECRVAVTM
ncbi:MAG: hypothetical protein E7632_02930 [Ruminococcaceae bacterium]|nr:hypothetical protein [Oscillospiraceae bacterium]